MKGLANLFLFHQTSGLPPFYKVNHCASEIGTTHMSTSPATSSLFIRAHSIVERSKYKELFAASTSDPLQSEPIQPAARE
jgi:hypothetical protein